MERVAAHVQPGGLVVAGFGLDAAHLPPGVPVTAVDTYDRACVAGLSFLRTAPGPRRPGAPMPATP